jgi:hypothetical protein
LRQLFSAVSELNTNINPNMQKNVGLGLKIKDYWVSIPCEKPLANPRTSEEAVITSQRPSCKVYVNKSVMQPLSYKSTAHNILHKCLHLKAYKMQLPEVLKPNEPNKAQTSLGLAGGN